MPIETLISAVMRWAERSFASREVVANVEQASKDASTAKTAANSAQATADAAQAAADEANGKADEIDSRFVAEKSFEWDGNTYPFGPVFFNVNGNNYHKISDYAPSFSSVKSVVTVVGGQWDASEFTDLYEGVNCYRAGNSMVVTKAGQCRIPASKYEGAPEFEFTAEAPGFYAYKYNNLYMASAKFTTEINLGELEDRVLDLDSRLSAIESTPNAEGVAF